MSKPMPVSHDRRCRWDNESFVFIRSLDGANSVPSMDDIGGVNALMLFLGTPNRLKNLLSHQVVGQHWDFRETFLFWDNGEN